jgi:cell division protein FtsB
MPDAPAGDVVRIQAWIQTFAQRLANWIDASALSSSVLTQDVATLQTQVAKLQASVAAIQATLPPAP